jgi:hypothetical protein
MDFKRACDSFWRRVFNNIIFEFFNPHEAGKASKNVSELKI